MNTAFKISTFCTDENKLLVLRSCLVKTIKLVMSGSQQIFLGRIFHRGRGMGRMIKLPCLGWGLGVVI